MTAANGATTTGADNQGDLKRRNVSGQNQANGSYVPAEGDEELEKKAKQQVCWH